MYWKQWLQMLLSLVVLLGLLEILLPPGGTAKFVRLVMGLSLMLALLQPLTLLVLPELGSIDLGLFSGDAGGLNLEMLADRVRLAAARPLLQQGGGLVVEQVEQALLSTGEVQQVRIELTSGSGPYLRVYLHPVQSRDRAANLISTLLNLPLSEISILPWPD